MGKAVTEDVLKAELAATRADFRSEMAVFRKEMRAEMRIEMDSSFMKLFKYLDRRFASIDKRFEYQDERIGSLYSLVDRHIKDVEIYHDEILVHGVQLDRHDRWIHQLADKTDTTLEYES